MQERVDELLTGFLVELGVSALEFFDVAKSASDKLTAFVVQTILTVDDFLMFKAMMVKRNMDLANQVTLSVGPTTQCIVPDTHPVTGMPSHSVILSYKIDIPTMGVLDNFFPSTFSPLVC